MLSKCKIFIFPVINNPGSNVFADAMNKIKIDVEQWMII